ncbi:MAG: restriction endonuclease subunit S [Chloroflexi bacterium]|nr:restriction endonuclease subunit S [Chloroflexota bacterium]
MTTLESNELPALPDGWVYMQIKELAKDVVTGNTPSKKDNENWGHDVPFIKPGDLDTNSPITSSTEYLSQTGSEKARILPENSVMVSCIGNLGKVGINVIPVATNQQINSIVLPENHCGKFFYYYCGTWEFKDALEKESSATTIAIVNKSKFSRLKVPVPPLEEQRRIVAAIEVQFSRLDESTAVLKRLQRQSQRYRAALLKHACEGQLLPQDPTDESADQLLQRILHERRQRWEAANAPTRPSNDTWKQKYRPPASLDTTDLPELPSGWVWATIDCVAESLDHMRIPINKKERAERNGDIPYYGANGQTGWIDDFIFNEPLVLVVEDETFTGRQQPFCYKITGKTWVNNHAHVLRACATSTDYLNYSLTFYPFTPLTTGTTGRRKLTKKALIEAPYALPPLAEQKRIVEEVERRLTLLDALDHTLATTLQRANRLRQAILQRAFTGQLVPPSPHHDEPAPVTA